MKVLLITPPFTQLNTTYPATAYLKGFLNTLDISSFQADLSLEVILKIFSTSGLTQLWSMIEEGEYELTDLTYRTFTQKHGYLRTIDPVMRFLQNQNQTLAHTICAGGYLPQGARFDTISDLDWAFGTMSSHDKARHLCTLYLEEIGDLITETLVPHFGFSRYAERLARTATHFDELFQTLQQNDDNVIITLKEILDNLLQTQRPDLVCITAPFPGNVFAAFKCGQFIKAQFPDIKIAFGGGYANTELRSIYDQRVFHFVDYILLDDGEAPLQHLIEHLKGDRPKHLLKRTFCLDHEVVTYINGSVDLDVPQREVGTPDYSDLLLDKYLSVIEVVNPMHRLWSDGRWNKLTLAHGCYWGKCSFCDVTLDYIQRYEPVSATILCDRIATIMTQTGQNGFHFVDEAAPPALMRDLAIEILRRGLTVVWWANIRFEKSFSDDLCILLRKSGCIAISGGLEVASDRLLAKMKKGVTVAQVARVAKAFTDAGVMVHAYLMYGFPTQTAQETIDSLEMVRQLMENGIIQSGFWHQFAMTAHSPVGLDPASFGVVRDGPDFGGFAENDLYHTDPNGADHELFSEGLKISLHNYMQGLGFEETLDIWFDFDVPVTSIDPDFIANAIASDVQKGYRDYDQLIWVGGDPIEMIVSPNKSTKRSKDHQVCYSEILISGTIDTFSLFFECKVAEWAIEVLECCDTSSTPKYTFQDMRESYNSAGLSDFDGFVVSFSFDRWRSKGLLIL
ncbi:MAG: radical SAM protein [Saprospiraceae bacterium]